MSKKKFRTVVSALALFFSAAPLLADDGGAAFGKILTTPGAPPAWSALAELRMAQSYRLDGNAVSAKAAYAHIQTNTAYPAHLREEAAELLQEMERLAQGLPARDVAASRITLPPIENFAAKIWVASDGGNSNPGTEDKPVATLQKARDLVRVLRLRVKGPIAVILKSGEYPLSAGLTLTAEDSGSAGAPVVWKAQAVGQSVLYGGTRLKKFVPVTDPAVLDRLPAEARGKVWQCDLRASGITDYGALVVRGYTPAAVHEFDRPYSPPTLELYVNQKPMTLARWPNEGFVRPTQVIEAGDRKAGEPSVLGYDDARPARWTKANDAWIFGYFHYLWADATAKIGKIDPVAKTITTVKAYDYRGRGMTNEQGIIYYAFNLLEELDRPGEWYLDRDSGILYLYPPSDLDQATVELSLLSQPMISATGLAHVRCEGLVFDLARSDGLMLKDCSDCQFAGCTVQRMAGNGISILGGLRDTLLSCDVHTIGRRAMEVIGGDRATLTSGGHVVANCRIADFGRIDRTYTPGVQLEGVGHRVAHNLFSDCPSSVMRIEGNDHLIEYNEVCNAVLESDDQGAMELFGNPTYRGVIFRYNLFHSIGSGTNQKLKEGQAGIRFDDGISGMLVYGNIFYRAANGKFGGINMNAGRDNIIDNNSFIECAQGVTGGYRTNNLVWQRLREGNQPADYYTNELYVKRYPEIATMLQAPAVNHGWRNIFYRCGRDFTGKKAALDLLANGVFTNQNPGFVDIANGNLQLKPDASVLNSFGFRPIPLEEIGLYRDQWQTFSPTAADTGSASAMLGDVRATNQPGNSREKP